MLKKILAVCFLTVVLSVPAMAVEPPAGAKVPWVSDATAYTSERFNSLMEAHGLKLPAEAVRGVPHTYAAVSGEKVKFNNNSMAFRPLAYHAILTSYGLTLSPEAVSAKLGWTNYATVRDGKIVFGNLATAYNPSEWRTILSAYGLELGTPVKPAAIASAAATGPGDADGDGVSDDKDDCPATPQGITVDERGCWSHPTALLFDLDKAVIKVEYYSVLDESRAVFKAYPNMKVQIDGYACDLGPEAYNQDLSERRAEAVRDFLVKSVGIDPSRLSTAGYGETRPAFPNDSEANRQKNRRVEFIPLN
jgi:outer membrane protein OmpA-like peptidoglycan-associated protein